MPDLISLYSGLLAFLWEARWFIALAFVVLITHELSALSNAVRIHAVLMSVTIFLVITSYWILKPIKKGLFLSHYKAHTFSFAGADYTAAQVELLAKEVNVVLAIIAAIIFSALSRRYTREHFYVALIAAFAFAFMLFAMVGDFTSVASIWLFYLSGDLFVTMLVAGFYAFLNDSEMPGSAKRLYGLIGLGGTMGGVVGSSMVAGHAKGLTPQLGLLYAAVLTVIMVVPVLLAGRIVRQDPPLIRTPPDAEPRFYGKWSRFFNGLDVVTRSRYLMGIAAIVGIYEIVSTLIDYQFSATIVHFVEGPKLGDAFAQVFTVTNLVAVAVQLILTRRILTRFGIGPALALLPFAILLGSLGYMLMPVLLFGALLNTFDNGLAYSLNQSAKEVLYVPVSPGDKYRAKAFIDIFVLRTAKGLAVLLSIAVSFWFASFEDIRWLSLWVVMLLALWLFIVFHLSRAYARREAMA